MIPSQQNPFLSRIRVFSPAQIHLLPLIYPLSPPLPPKDQLLSLAKAVANATAGLVVKAKNLATQPNLDPEAQQRVIAAATQTGLCTSQLVACTKVRKDCLLAHLFLRIS